MDKEALEQFQEEGGKMREGEEFRLDGYKWTSLNKAKDKIWKLGWAIGFYDGVNQAAIESIGSLIVPGFTVQGTIFEVDPTIKERVGRTADLLRKKLDFSGITFSQMVDGLDNFYKDYRNMTVLAQEAIWIVKLELRGAPQDFIDEEARILRMPGGKRYNECSSLLEKNQAYRKAWQKWGNQIPAILWPPLSTKE